MMFRPVYSEYASRFSSAVMKKKKKYIHFGSTRLIAQLIFLSAHLKNDWYKPVSRCIVNIKYYQIKWLAYERSKKLDSILHIFSVILFKIVCTPIQNM